MTPLKKVILILLVFLISVYFSLPKSLPLNFELGGETINTTLTRKDINITRGSFNLQKNFDLVLGLDLAGGSHLVFEADTSKVDGDRKDVVLQGLRDVIERRVNLFGVSEPNVQVSSFEDKDRIIVELPGIKDTREAINLIGETAQLVFAEVGGEETPGFNNTKLTGADLKDAQVVFDQTTGQPVVALEFSDEGADKFAQITEKNIGKPLAILIDEVPISAPVVQNKIVGGSAQITGDFSLEEARNLVIQLNAGSLPVSINLVEQRTVGATLGQESVAKSVQAGLIGLLMVMIFMVLSYGKMGLIADFALAIFASLTLFLYKLIPVVLTLPGIAGFLLSVGMAVDANILIFERFKEEKRQRDFKNALEVSFGRAWDSIRDANVATLLTAFVLANPFDWTFLNTSGPVRGFAITLALGIIISLFTGVVVSRNMLRVFLKSKKIVRKND